MPPVFVRLKMERLVLIMNKDAREHASDGLVTDALMPRMIFFLFDREIGHYTSEYVLPQKVGSRFCKKSKRV